MSPNNNQSIDVDHAIATMRVEAGTYGLKFSNADTKNALVYVAKENDARLSPIEAEQRIAARKRHHREREVQDVRRVWQQHSYSTLDIEDD